MATTIQEVSELLDRLGLKYEKHDHLENVISVVYGTENYVYKTDTDEKKRVVIFIEIMESGELLNLVAPFIYSCPNDFDKSKKLALFQTLLEIQTKFKYVRFIYDSSDGQIQLKIPIALEDTLLTSKVLGTCLLAIPRCLDLYHTDIMDALNEGLLPESEEAKQKALEEFQRQRRQQRRNEFD